MEISREIVEVPDRNPILKVLLGQKLDTETKQATGNFELDIEARPRFMKMIQSLSDEGAAEIIVDIRYVTYLDSSGLWSLLEGYKKIDMNGGFLIYVFPTKDVLRILDITKLSTRIFVVHSEQEAMEALSNFRGCELTGSEKIEYLKKMSKEKQSS